MKRKAIEEGQQSLQRLSDEAANICFTEELNFETEVAQAAALQEQQLVDSRLSKLGRCGFYADIFYILLQEDHWIYVTRSCFFASLSSSSSVPLFIHTDGSSV